MLCRASNTVLCLLLSTAAAASAENGPITAVMLSSGGLAEVVRKANIDSNGLINMTVPLDQVNDILKSVVVFDEAGVVEGITLPGPNPLAETFKNLPFSVQDLQAPDKLLSALQGARVRIEKAGSKTEGLVLGVSSQDKGQQGQAAFVSVLSDGKISAIELSADTEIRFLDAEISKKIERALLAVGSGKSDGARDISLKVAGEGEREVAVSYVVPTPIWKTAYRAVTIDAEKARLQAWAVVENASGEDWIDVSVTLSSGAPVTLKQRLHDLYWRERSEVPVDIGQGYVPRTDTGAEPSLELVQNMAPGSAAAARFGMLAEADFARPSPVKMAQANVGTVNEGAVTASFSIPWKVSLKSGETLSAPIVDQVVPAESVSVFQPESGLQHPIAAILIDNETATSLPKGILTVYDQKEGYVGDAQINGMPAGESRLASFATDKKVRVAQETSGDRRIDSVKVVDGVLTASVREWSSTRYIIQGAADAPRVVVVEHKKRPGWNFSSENQLDSTASHNRMKVSVPMGETKTVTAVDERLLSETYGLLSESADRLYFLSTRAPDNKTARKLAELAKMRTSVANLEREIESLQGSKEREANDQRRYRSNLSAVQQGTNLYKSAVRKLEESELRIEGIDTEIAGLNKQRTKAETDLRDAVRSF